MTQDDEQDAKRWRFIRQFLNSGWELLGYGEYNSDVVCNQEKLYNRTVMSGKDRSVEELIDKAIERAESWKVNK